MENPAKEGGPASRRYDDTADSEARKADLPRGDVTEGVVRIGDTVRRPHQPQSLAVADYLDHLERVGFTGSPRYLGRDSAGRDVLTYLHGDVAGSPPEAWAADDRLLESVAVLVRRLHEASAGYAAERGFAAPDGSGWRRQLVQLPAETAAALREIGPDPEPELVSHLDVTPQNVVVRDGMAVGLVDFDMAGPTTRLIDVYNTAMHWVPVGPPEDGPPAWTHIDRMARLRLFVDAYGLPTADRRALPDLAIAGAQRSWLRMRAAAQTLGGGWARMWREGVGDAIRRREAWLRNHHDELLVVLLDGVEVATGASLD